MSGKTIARAGVVGAALLVAASVGAQPPEGKARAWGGQRHADFLQLTDAQKAQVKELHQAQRPQMQALWKSLGDNRKRLEEALGAPNPDPAAVGELAIEGHRLHQQARQLHDSADKAMRALLTPEQQVRFDAMREMRGGRGPMGWRGGHPFGPPRGGPDGPPPFDE